MNVLRAAASLAEVYGLAAAPFAFAAFLATTITRLTRRARHRKPRRPILQPHKPMPIPAVYQLREQCSCIWWAGTEAVYKPCSKHRPGYPAPETYADWDVRELIER